MHYRKLTLLVLVGLSISAYYSYLFLSQSGVGFSAGPLAARGIACLALAAALQFVALFLRAHKWSLLTAPLRKGPLLDHVKSLAIGCVFNVLFPLRLGEFVRAHLLGRRLLISRSSVFCTILFERALDGLFLSTFFALLCGAHLARADFAPFTKAVVFMFTASLAILALLYLLYTESPRGIALLNSVAVLFNDRIRDGLRLIGWSAIHGTHLFLKATPLGLYLLETVLMWGAYIGSMMLVLAATEEAFSSAGLVVAVNSLIGIGIPSGPGSLGIYHYLIANSMPGAFATLGTYAIYSWAMAVVPVPLLGIRYLLGSEDFARAGLFPSRGKQAGAPELAIYRSEQSSPDFLNFLDTYFSGLELSQLVGRYEIAGDVRFVKMLRGGSNALSLLVWTPEGHRVRKLSLPPFAGKLRFQHAWLKERSRFGIFPEVLGLTQDDRSVFFDMAYYPEHHSFYNFIHNNEPSKGREALTRIVDSVGACIHLNPEPVESRETLERYLKEKVFDKVNDCLIYDPRLGDLFRRERLSVNGVEVDNFSAILARITDDERMMGALSRFQRSDIHGDLTVDNILIHDGDLKLLDPNNENIVSDPLVDYAKLYQSLHSGYENLIRLGSAEVDGGVIRFDEETSSRYGELFAHLLSILEPRVGPKRMSHIKFHEAVHFARMLPYRLRIDRKTFPVFYAVMVRLFNEFHSEASGGSR
ncbi:MAG: flippase-like domain-containing protein [Elusimicrobia bacterium]|nr:flippase-like domain-containing protein [Elusimicrobiota bacterium]